MIESPNFGVFPLGTHVYREPHQDQEELFADLPVLARLGFNMIKIQESWAIDEPREGEYDFARIERLIARAGELGMGVYLGLTMEQAPAWLWRKHPDCRMVYASGQPLNDPTQFLLPADGKPGPCWDHPGARAAGERFVGALARQLGRFENIWTWNTWQEIGFWHNDGGALGLCYCPSTLARFREWVRGKYGDLATLNAAWSTGFGDWEEVEPQRRFSANPPYTDWRWFMDNVYMERALGWKTAALRANDPGQRPVFSHVGQPRVGSSSEWRWAKVADFFGNSNYPAWSPYDEWDHDAAERPRHATLLHEVWNSLMLRTDICRGANGRGRALWGAEFQGGPISTHLHLGRTPDAADIRRWMLAGLASGMHGISFWNQRAERSWQEANGFGLLDPQGESTARIEEAGRVGRAINEHWELFARGEPPRARVAILVNDDLYHFHEGTLTNALHLFSFNLRGHFARLWRLGYAVDFLSEDDVAAGDLAHYEVALLPMPLSLDDAYMANLREYVEGGGTLISDACPGRFDRYGFCRRAQMAEGARELFGVEHAGVRIVREPAGQERWTPPERGWGEFAPASRLDGAGDLAGTDLAATFYLQTLTPTTAEPILMWGDAVAGVSNTFGKGRGILLGTFAGLSATAYPDADGDRFFAHLLGDTLGVEPDRCGRLLRRRRLHGTREAWFLINPSDEVVSERIDLESRRLVGVLLGDAPAVEADGTVRIEVEPVGLACLVLEGKDA